MTKQMKDNQKLNQLIGDYETFVDKTADQRKGVQRSIGDFEKEIKK